MRFIAYILTAHVVISVFTANINLNNKKDELNKLQKQKDELLELINGAINETVTALTMSNETDAEQGIQLMKTLKEALKKLNVTEIDIPEVAENYFKHTRNKENTTLFKIERRNARDDLIRLQLLDIAKLFKQKSPLRRGKNVEYQNQIQNKIEEWKVEREKEKAKIKDYKKKQREHAARMKLEDCPDLGIGKTKRGFKNPKHPCCRKCCKHSYMGCL